jgi:hypothetical protein
MSAYILEFLSLFRCVGSRKPDSGADRGLGPIIWSCMDPSIHHATVLPGASGSYVSTSKLITRSTIVDACMIHIHAYCTGHVVVLHLSIMCIGWIRSMTFHWTIAPTRRPEWSGVACSSRRVCRVLMDRSYGPAKSEGLKFNKHRSISITIIINI